MKTKKLSFLLSILFLFTLASQAFAVNYDLKEETPAVKSAIEGRQSRWREIRSLKDKNLIGEDNQGYVKALAPEAEQIAAVENADRETIYHAIVAQNHLPPSSLSEVQTVFMEVHHRKARNGDSIQLPSGEWIKK